MPLPENMPLVKLDQTRPVADLFGCLPPYKGPALTIEEMNETMAIGAAQANR